MRQREGEKEELYIRGARFLFSCHYYATATHLTHDGDDHLSSAGKRRRRRRRRRSSTKNLHTGNAPGNK